MPRMQLIRRDVVAMDCGASLGASQGQKCSQAEPPKNKGD
jgi:hypothetical protein